MRLLSEQPVVRETEHLVPRVGQITKAVFPEGLYIPWQGRQDDQGSLETKVGDGLLWLIEEVELWLIELEWKLGSNYLKQVQTFAESKVATQKLQSVLEKNLKNVWEAFVGHPTSVPVHAKLITQKYCAGDLLKPNMWVILGHEGNETPEQRKNYDKLREQYERVTGGCFAGRKYLITMVRLFSDAETKFLLLDNYWSDNNHSALLVPLDRYDQESTDHVLWESGDNGPRPRHKAAEVWAWLESKNTWT